MKHILIILLFLTGCVTPEDVNQIKSTQYQVNDFGWVGEIEVDSCEYIFFKSGHGGGLSHKGNCKYCRELK